MIPFAVFAGLMCLALASFEAWRRPGDPYTTMRVPVAGVWAATWLCYGINPASFPAPSTWTLVVLTVACAGTLLTSPVRGRILPATCVPVAWVQWLLLGLAMLTIAGDLFFITDRVVTYGLTGGLGQYRMDRITKAGQFAVPGLEVIHAAVTASGALGFGQWLVTKRTSSLLLAACGFMVALLSTGRWEVVAYVVWLLAIDAFVSARFGLRTLAAQAGVYGLLVVFFVAHGQLLGKVDGATALANASPQQRAEAARDLPKVLSGGLRSQAVVPRLRPPVQLQTCPRWVESEARANGAFRTMPRVSRVLVLYFAGPLATLDRALCEGRDAERVVLMYWPNKIARLLGLREPEFLLAADPFLDIGIPFNNQTVIYQFLSEVGPRAGLLAWLAFGALVGVASRLLLQTHTAAAIVAGTAPLAMAIRTPWNNTFFDGTLVVWVGVALLPLLAPRALAAVRRQ